MKLTPSDRKHLILEVLVLLAATLMLLRPVAGHEYRRYATDTLSYVRGRVLEVVSQDLTDSTLGTGQKLGSQRLLVRLPDGQEIQLDNYLTETHNILLKAGQSAIICVDAPQNAAPYYTVYNYDRFLPLLGSAATILGELAACLLFAAASAMLHLTGFQTDSAEGLLLIAQNTGLNIRTLLLAGMMIAALGAVMDVAVSVLSALREVALASKKPKRGELFRSGMIMGRDMMGTMSNTLIFAFTGGALATMLVFYSYGVQFQQLFNSDYLAVELAQGLCSTAAVIFTVPVSAAMGALYYGKRA